MLIRLLCLINRKGFLMLPQVQIASSSYNTKSTKLFIVAEGFEKRSLHWISQKSNTTLFQKSIICRYSPSKKSRFDEILGETKKRTQQEPVILDYNRFEPTVFEHNFRKCVDEMVGIEEIILDISVMSKLLIMIILCCLKCYNGKLTILYSEPSQWGPSEKKYNETVKNRTYGTCIGLSSVGVGNLVRTPYLSSVVMQNCPILLVAFLSFNEQLINVLINEISPTQVQMINHKCNQAKWRENAMRFIHQELINDFSNSEFKDNVHLYDLMDYQSVFSKLAEIYRDNCYNYRIVIAPTGCKIHAISCALLKLCCSDVHIEYPTPESYLFDDYSSEKVSNVHEIVFDNYSRIVNELRIEYSLDG